MAVKRALIHAPWMSASVRELLSCQRASRYLAQTLKSTSAFRRVKTIAAPPFPGTRRQLPTERMGGRVQGVKEPGL